jgi:hypothetical protein
MSIENRQPLPAPAERDMSMQAEQALASASHPIVSQAHGEGRRYPVGGAYDEPQGWLDVYPTSGFVRWQSEGTAIGGRFPDPPFVERDRLVFSAESETEFRTMTVTDQGEVTLFLAPVPPLREPDPIDQAFVRSLADERLIAEAMAKQPIAADQPKPEESNIKTASNTKAETERGERVELSGRVGRDPRVRETAKGTLIAKFPLAEHPEGDENTTQWHTIVAFKERAAFVRDNVKKGQEVKVIGYTNDHEHDGKTYQEINAVVVKPPKPPAASGEGQTP